MSIVLIFSCLKNVNQVVWQGIQCVKITFPELGKIDVEEIQEVLDG